MGRRIGFLGLVNYRNHPADNRYKIFSFYSKAEADLFQSELEERKIWFEANTDELKEGTVFLFGVDNSDFNRAQKANFVVSAKYRNPIIKNKFLRIALMSLFFGLLTLAIVGYVKNQQILKEKTEQLENE